MALALFALTSADWLIGLVVAQIFVYMAITWALSYEILKYASALVGFVYIVGIGIGSAFNIVLTGICAKDNMTKRYLYYAIYWLLMMVEIGIFMALWGQSVRGKHLWYYTIVLWYVILGYLLSFFIKTIHTEVRKHNRGKCFWDWYC